MFLTSAWTWRARGVGRPVDSFTPRSRRLGSSPTRAAVFARSIYKLALGSAADAEKFISQRVPEEESRERGVGGIPGP